MSVTPIVGRGIGPVYLEFVGKEKVFSTSPCQPCRGTGWLSYDRWVNVSLGARSTPVNFGHKTRCFSCDGSGRIVKAIYTRGVSITPLIRRPV